MESLPFPFYMIDPGNYRIVMANSKAGSAVGKPCYEVAHNRSGPCDGSEHPCGMRQVMEKKRSFVTEHIHLDEQGRPRNIEVHMHPVFNEQDEVVHILEYCLDITERRKRERDQDRMAMELYAIYENVPFFICVIDRQYRVVHANQYLSILTGIPNEQLFGATLGKVFGCIENDEDPVDCGLGKDCFSCPLRVAVKNTFATGKGSRNIEKTFTIKQENHQKKIILNGSTSLIQRYGNDRLLICLQDVTEQRENERLLRVLSQAVDQSPVTLVITDTNGLLEYANPKFTETTGYSLQEAMGRKTSILRGPDKTDAEYREMWNTILSGENWRGLFHNRKKDGNLYWEEAVISPVKDRNGKIQNFFAVKEDITERKKMEEQLRLQTRAIDDSTSAVVIADALAGDNPIIYVNPAFEKITGYSSHEVIGKNCRFLQGSDRDQPGLETIRISLDQGRACQALLRNYRKDGSVFWNNLRITPLQNAENQITHFVGIADDVTKFKEVQEKLLLNEKRLRMSQDYASIGTWDWNIKTGEILWSETGMALFGRDKVETKTTVAEFLEMVHPDDRKQVEKKMREALEERKDYHIEYRCLRPDRSLRWLQASGNIIRDKSGQPLQMLGVVQDITERKRQEQELIISREEANKANRAKSEFLSSMSHELRTPMNAIMGFGQLLDLDPSLNDEQKDSVREIRKAGKHLLDLINEVLDLSRIETGRIELSPEAVEYNTLVNECYTLLNPMAKKKDVAIIIETDPHLYLHADRLRLKQILVNLMTNAIKYNVTGGEVHVSVSRNKERARIAVRDTGPGIPEEKMSHLFEPFNRLGAETLDIEGTGIGLTLSKRLVELMNGVIGVESLVGSGSTFWIELSLAEKPGTTVQEKTDEGLSPLGSEGAFRVLYIEDNPSNLRLVERILADEEKVFLNTAQSPSDGLRTAEEHPPDLVLLDINLPEMNGYTVFEKIRETPWGKDIPVVAISANAMTRDIDKGASVGFADYITKPIDVPHFLQVLNRLMKDLPHRQDAPQ